MFCLKDDTINSTFKIIVMKYTLIIALLTLLAIRPMSAQMDDVYYNPDEVVKTKNSSFSSNRSGSYKPESYSADAKGYSEGENSYYDDYDFYYTSRIRRFHRPLQGFSFFDPYYVDMAYYDPFLRSAGTMLIYDDFYTQRAFSRFNRWNSFNNFNRWNSFGMYDPFFSPWISPFSRFGAGMSMSSFAWVGSPFMYMPTYNFFGYMPTWGNGYGYNNWGLNNNNVPVTPVDGSNGHYGPRRGGGSVGPVPGARNPEIGTIESTPRTNPSAGRNMPIERNTRIPSVQGAGRYPSTEGRIPSSGGYSPRVSEPSVEYSRQRPSTSIQPRTSSEIRSAERINSTTRSTSPSRNFDSPSSSPSWSTPRSSSVGSGSSSLPSSSSAPSSGGRSSSGGRVINQ
ncbi:MAG: hypothetical protein EBS35_05545 [Bacteroidetes bacterium]|nr:hypothetical protein [Bacteroidota bacterium]